MKTVVLKHSKKNNKIKKKVFTKKKGKDIIKKDYNPLKVNCKIYKRGSGLYMKEGITKEEIKKELNLNEFINQRIAKNSKLFSEEEIAHIKDNNILMEKIYILGLLDNI